MRSVVFEDFYPPESKLTKFIGLTVFLMALLMFGAGHLLHSSSDAAEQIKHQFFSGMQGLEPDHERKAADAMFAASLNAFFVAIALLKKGSNGHLRYTWRGISLKFLGFNVFVVLALLLGAFEEKPFHEVALYGNAPPLLLSVAMVLVVGTGLGLFRTGARLDALSAEKLLKVDPRPPVVFLRSFSLDGAKVVAEGKVNIFERIFLWLATRVTYTTPEQELVSLVGRFGPVIAVGKPNESLPELGAARLYVHQESWQETVIGLLKKSSLAVVVIGNTAGIRWEVEQALKLKERHQILFVSFGGGEQSRQAIQLMEKLTGVAAQFELPKHHDHMGLFIYFNEAGEMLIKEAKSGWRWPGLNEISMHSIPLLRHYQCSLQEIFSQVFSDENPLRTKKRGAAIWLALIGGVLGLHWYYLGGKFRGLTYMFITGVMCLWLTKIVPLAALLWWMYPYFEALRFLFMSRRDFEGFVKARAL